MNFIYVLIQKRNWIILALMLGTLIRASVNLPEYRIRYSDIWLIKKGQGDVRFENFILIAFLNVFLLIVFENWKIVRNTTKGASFSIRGFSFCSRFISSLTFLVLTGFILAILFWGKSLTPPGENKVFVAVFSSNLSRFQIVTQHFTTQKIPFVV